MPFAINSDNSGQVSAAGQVKLPAPYSTPAAAPHVASAAAPDTSYIASTDNRANPSAGYFVPGFSEGSAPAQQQPLAPYATDPGYQAALGQQQSGLAQLDASLKAARERAIIDFGDPSMAQTAGFGLDPNADAFAQQNYKSGNSVLSRLDKNHDLMRQAVINRLASHGILNSGELGYGTGQVDSQYGNQLYDAKKSLLDYLNGVTATDLQNRQQLSGGVISAIQNAYGNFLNHPELFPADTTPPAAALAPPVAKVAAATTKAKAKAVQKVLVNPYTTGQKRFG